MAAVKSAEALLRERLQSHLLLYMPQGDPSSWHVFVWLIEEWCLACSLLRQSSPFVLRLHAPERLWRRAMLEHLAEEDGKEAEKEEAWVVTLVVDEVDEAAVSTCLACD